jgi:hypothetical protein
MRDLSITWSTFLVVRAAQPHLKGYYVQRQADPGVATYSYTAFLANLQFLYSCDIAGDDVAPFEAGYKADFEAVASVDDAAALLQIPVNSLGAQLVEVTSNLSQPATWTVVTHDYSEPCTWWQNSTQVTNEVLTDAGAGVFTSAHPLWINVEHPKIMADQFLNPGWAAGGYQNQDFWYYSWMMPDGTLRRRNYFYPVIEVQPGGSGSWVIADPASTAGAPNYAYTIDYTNGAVHFNDQTGWTGGTLVRASYYYAVANNEGSAFEVGPPSGKKWFLIRTEVQMSTSPSWRDSVILAFKQSGITGGLSVYKSYANMQATAMEAVLTQGATGTAATWPAGPDNGWTHGGCNGMRGSSKPMETNRWIYDKPYILVGSLNQRLNVSLGSGLVFQETDVANVTYYFNEYNE